MPRTALRLSFALSLMLVGLFTLAGCAAPASSGGGAEPPATSTPTPRPTGGTLPPRQAGAITVDYACSSNADCAVKDVGNCCGSMPACVNKNSPTDPQGVRAQCAASGMAGICGFAEVSACQCVSGRCEADASSSPQPVAR